MANVHSGSNSRPPSRVAAQQPITVTVVTSPSTINTPQGICDQTPVGQGRTVNP